MASGHVLRRAKTIDASLPPPPRPPADPPDGLSAPPPRRGSSLFDYSNEARDVINPKARLSPEPESSSSLTSVSLAVALLPAISGALFKNGHAVATDMMLLGLAGIFLHWSVTQPWCVARPVRRAAATLMSEQGLVSRRPTSAYPARRPS